MSQMQNYYSPAPPVSSRRPGSVTALSIIGIIIGAIGTLGLFGIISLLVDGDVVRWMRTKHPIFYWYSIGSGIVGGGAAIGLLIASIRSLKLAPSARSSMIWIATIMLAVQVVGLIALPIAPKQSDLLPPGYVISPHAVKAQSFISIFMALAMICYMMFVIIVFRSAAVVAAFNSMPVEAAPITGPYAPPGQSGYYQQQPPFNPPPPPPA